ncbi:MAG: prolipoprotein diacylglyceryl transferase [Rickettsiales bacterium]|jgi:phosphatidylglycerol:prolipoprotein diacylglycerol transferase|nr:prolipoprotein diacylglyceryl transferase [Rickettsiales bacterium]
MVINPISPVAVNIFGLEIRWYALAYIAAFIIGYWLMRRLAGKNPPVSLQSKKLWDDLLAAVIIGVIVGGRLGYVLFYNLSFFIEHPLEIFAVWHGGMAFHGGLLGAMTGVFIFAKRQIKQTLAILDIMAVVAPIGLFFGRIANFINIEVMGRATDGPLGIVFAGTGDQTPRYPSPLFEAGLEGILLFLIMFCLWKFTNLRKTLGALSGIFAMLYAVFRIFAEQFREPDAQIGFLTGWGLTMGMLLSALMFVAGAAVLWSAFRARKICADKP